MYEYNPVYPVPRAGLHMNMMKVEAKLDSA